MKPAAYYKGKEQTYLKHYFLERYLETVAFHIGYTHKEFVYVDCFSGPWLAADEELADTSIRIALDKLNYVRNGLAAQQRYANIRAVFVEKDSAAFRTLQTTLDHHRGAIKTTALPGTFEDNITAILQEVGTAFAFFFIDPKGWSGFAMDNIAPILRHQPGEVMVNFMYDFINRFINYPDPANEQSLGRFFGTTTWRDIRNVNDREGASLECYKEQLRTFGGYPYVTSTRILKPRSDRAYFHLVYATRNPKGIIEFRRVEKQTVNEQDAVRTTAQREHRETKTGQTELAFAPTGDLSPTTQDERTRRLHEAKERLYAILQQGPIQYEQLQPRILELPLVWNTDLTELLLAARQDRTIAINGMGKRDRTPKKGCTILLTTATPSL
jgi:three-Cys-motif partner protein